MAVYTRVDEDELVRLLTRYDIGALESFEGITQGVENTNYCVTTTTGKYILTLYEKRVKPEDLPFFVDLMRHLGKNGIDCPHPVADASGTVLQDISGRKATIVTFLPGISPVVPTAAECFTAGRTLAELHLAGQDYGASGRANALGHDSWPELLTACVNEGGLAAGKTKTDTIKNRLDEITGNWPGELPQGIIHADYFPNNVFFTGGKVTGIIDFYFACTDALAYDLAIAVNAWCFDPDGAAFHIEKSENLIAGYQSMREMNAREVAAMPVLCSGAALRFYLTRLYDLAATPADAQVRPHDPVDYSNRLDFHTAVRDRGPAAYGLEP